MKSQFLFTGITLFLLVLFCSCEDDDPVLCDPTPQFSIEEFKNQIETRLEAQPIIGYQYVISRNGNRYHHENRGLARHPDDPGGPVAIDSTTRFNTASIAKFIATIALVNALEDRDLSLELDFMDYLPQAWQNMADPNHAYSFRELLTHETAIDFQGSTPPAGNVHTEAQLLQSLVDPPDPDRQGVYQNGNFNLVRVLIGEIVYNLEVDAMGNYADGNICTDRYNQYLEETLFVPLNLDCPSTASELIDYYDNTLYPYAYQHPFDFNFMDPTGGLGWSHSNNPYTTSGAAGLMLSALEIAKIVAYFKHDNTGLIISELGRNRILEFELGLNNTLSGVRGTYYSKSGTRGPDGSVNAVPPTCCDRAIRSRFMIFPNGVEVVVITNSDFSLLGTMMMDAYDASWFDPC